MQPPKINSPLRKPKDLKWLVFCLGAAVLFWAGCEPGVDKKELEAWTKQKVIADWGVSENIRYNHSIKVWNVDLARQNQNTYIGEVTFKIMDYNDKTELNDIDTGKEQKVKITVVADKDKRFCEFEPPVVLMAEIDRLYQL